MRANIKILARAAAWCVAALWALSACQSSGSLVGSPPPDTVFESVDSPGKTVRASDFKGKVVLIDFWATWCGPCQDLMPHVKELADRYSGQGLEVLEVSSEDRSAVEAFKQSGGAGYPLYLDTAKTSTMDYRYDAIPTLVLIGRDGIVRQVIEGDDSQALESALRREMD